jgi:hypothetical protein
MADFSRLVNSTISRYIASDAERRVKNLKVIAKLFFSHPLPPAKPQPPPFIPPPRNDFLELRKRISDLQWEVDEYYEKYHDDEDFCERDRTDEEIELDLLEDELLHLERTADMIGAMSPGVKRL